MTLKERRAEQTAKLRQEAIARIDAIMKSIGRQYVWVDYRMLYSEHNDKLIVGVGYDPYNAELGFLINEGTIWSIGHIEDDNVFEVLEMLEKHEYSFEPDEDEEGDWFAEKIANYEAEGQNKWVAPKSE